MPPLELPAPTSSLDLFIARHGRKFAAFFMALAAVCLLSTVAMWIVARTSSQTAERIKDIATHTITAVGALAGLMITGNAVSHLAHRGAGESTSSSTTTTTSTVRPSGAIPAGGVGP